MAYPSDLGNRPPTSSTLNFGALETVANLAITSYRADVAGWFSNADVPTS